MLDMPKKKTVQIRIAIDVAADAGLVAPAVDMSVPEYIEHAVRAAVSRDLPKLQKRAQERAAALKGEAKS